MSNTILQNAISFFHANAGYCHDPKTETPEQGHQRCAEALAVAERDGASQGLTFEWTEDDGEFSDDERKVQLWVCICRHPVGDALATVGGIDIGESNPPHDAYCRVIQAELAMQALAELAKDDTEEAEKIGHLNDSFDRIASEREKELSEDLQEAFNALTLQEQLNSAIEELDQDKTTRQELEHYKAAIRAAFGWLPDDKRKELIEELRRTR